MTAPGLSTISGSGVQVLENLLGGTNRLLVGVADARQPLHRFVRFQQRIEEADKAAGGLHVVQDQLALVIQKAGNGDGAQNFHERRGNGLRPAPTAD